MFELDPEVIEAARRKALELYETNGTGAGFTVGNQPGDRSSLYVSTSPDKMGVLAAFKLNGTPFYVGFLLLI